jgi:tripartite ATP-independent transporter DctM subunit
VFAGGPGDGGSPRPAGKLHAAENLLVASALAAMALLPLAEVLARKLFGTGITGAAPVVQHLVLLVGMLGGALAARDDRLLSLSTVRQLLRGRGKLVAAVASNGVALGVTVLLGVASYRYVMVTRGAGKILVYGVPVWVAQSILPLGFALIAGRILLRTPGKWWPARAVAAGIAALFVALGAFPPADPAALLLPALAVLAAATILGAPIFTVLGGAALILFWGQGSPVASLAIDHYRMVVNPSLATIPLFTLAGYFLAEGGASQRLIRVFRALVGGMRGGPAVLTALVCAFFTSFTGASGVTILALGGLLLPVLLSAGYTERNAIGLLTGTGSLGLLFPPALPLILYAIVASTAGSAVSLEQMFLGGVLPGTLLVVLTAWWGVLQAPRASGRGRAFDAAEAGRALWEAKWELLLPVVALAALFGGFATPVEAAAITALYAFVVEAAVYRELKIARDTPSVMAECGLLVGGILLILGVAMGFTNYLIDAQVPDRAVDWALGSIHATWVFLLALNLFLLVVGCLMDIFSATIVVVPLIVPVAAAFGVDPVHLGILFLANMELGYITPPVGMNLFLSAYRFGKPVPEVSRSVIPMFFVLLLGVLLITYVPVLTTVLPRLLE